MRCRSRKAQRRVASLRACGAGEADLADDALGAQFSAAGVLGALGGHQGGVLRDGHADPRIHRRQAGGAQKRRHVRQ